ncbi:YjbH domain-containing protein [Vibrio astriarenae]|uniref:YjbH domain-containing protein n=1 Tax=Vibrio astriarenae TaxID=1481923 RepID=UPI0037361D85
MRYQHKAVAVANSRFPNAYFTKYVALYFCAIASSGFVHASGQDQTERIRIQNSLAQTGSTGLLRTPHAHVLPFGDINFSYHHEDNVKKSLDYGEGAHHTVLMGLGIFPHVELVVQNTHKEFSGDAWVPSTFSDLSASAKLDFDWVIPDDWFQLAVGIQDVGGEVSYHQTYYAVASKQIDRFRLSLGYGHNDDESSYEHQMGSDYLSGVFGGIEYQPLSWLQLVSDYDGTGLNAGVKAFTPSSWLPWGLTANLTYQAYSDSSTAERDNQWFGVGLTLPLSGENSASRYTRDNEVGVDVDEPTLFVRQSAITQFDSPSTNHDKAQTSIESLDSREQVAFEEHQATDTELQLSEKLVDYGFENVSVGVNESQLVVRVENNLFNQNELDALGVVLGFISELSDFSSFSLDLLKNNIAVINVSGTREDLIDIFHSHHAPLSKLTINRSFDGDEEGVEWASVRENSHQFKPKVILSPSLYSVIGSEMGVFDYSLALSTNVEIPVWTGALIDVRHMLPISNSDDYETGEYFGDDRHRNEIDRALIHQGIRLRQDTFAQISAGLIKSNYVGGTGELRWQSPEGTHKFGLEASYYEHKDDDSARSATPVLAHYRYYFDQYDWALEANAGEYWAGDTGFKLTSKHWFGDTAVSMFFEHSDHSFVGLNIALPLTFRKDMAPDPIQIRGIEQWTWGYRTMVRNEHNLLDGTLVQEVDLQNKIDRNYYNRDRLSARYINSNLQRLKDAYLLYR